MNPHHRKARIAAAFGNAADYSRHARVQHRVAEQLADRIAELPLMARKAGGLRLLELGCGTGFLTQALLDRGIGGDWLVTDLAPAMVTRCSETVSPDLQGARLAFRQLDGECLPEDLPVAGFDLVCASLAFQWFGDLAQALAKISGYVAPGGVLAFTTLVQGTLGEWDRAQAAEGLVPAGLPYPTADDLAAMMPAGGATDLRCTDEREAYPDARAFLKALKDIGAGTASRAPLGAGTLRRVMARFDAGGATATYRVATIAWTKDAPA